MKSYVSKLSSPLLLSPPINLYNFSISEILSSLSHKRCLSAKNSPYNNQTSIEKFNSAIRNSSRYHSPKLSIIKKKTQKKKPKKKIFRNSKKKTSKVLNSKKKQEELAYLEGKECFYAPKIFENQIFRDVYDETGKHDRVVEFSNQSKISSDDDCIVNGKLLIPNSIEVDEEKTESKCSPKPPDNSYLEDTKAPIMTQQDIINKLTALAKNQKKEYFED